MIDREELIGAYLDGALDSEEHQQVTQMLSDDPAARKLLADFQKLRNDLRSLPNYELDVDLTDQVLGQLAEIAAGPASSPSSEPAADRMVERGKRGRMFLWPAVAIAAALLVMIFSDEGPFKKEITRLDPDMQTRHAEEKARSHRDSASSPANEAVPSGSFFSAQTSEDSLEDLSRSSQLSAERSAALRAAGELEEGQKQLYDKKESAGHFQNSEDLTAANLAARGPPAGRAPPLPTYTFRVDRGVDPQRELDRLLGKSSRSGSSSGDRLVRIHPGRQAQKNSKPPAAMVYELAGTAQQIRQVLRELQAARGIRLLVVSADNDHEGFAGPTAFDALAKSKTHKDSRTAAGTDDKKEPAFMGRSRRDSSKIVPAQPAPVAAQAEVTLESEQAAAGTREKSTLPEAALQQVRLVFVIGQDPDDSLQREPQQQPEAEESGGPSEN
jgi:hypothetical protein